MSGSPRGNSPLPLAAALPLGAPSGAATTSSSGPRGRGTSSRPSDPRIASPGTSVACPLRVVRLPVMLGLSCRLARRQQLRRIDRLALLADLEMQLDAIGVTRTHLGDLLPAPHRLLLLHEQRL